MMKLKTHKFPCPHCKGQGSWHEFCLDSGECLDGYCSTCKGEGMLSPLSDGYKFLIEMNILENIFKLCPYVDKEIGMGLKPQPFRQAQSLIDQLIALGADQDNWSDKTFCRGCDTPIGSIDSVSIGRWEEFGVCSKACLDFVNQR